MNETYYPPGAFRFTVTVIGAGTVLTALTGIDASFQEVSGIQVEFGVEEVAEGGENRFVHRLPKQAKYSPLVLKRGVVTTASALGEWVGATIGAPLSLPIVPQNLLVTLLNGDNLPLIAWGFSNAYPLKWQTAPLNSMENNVLIETMELSYNFFVRLTLGSPAAAAASLASLASKLQGAV
jgi:phage tail-like protein